MNIHNNRYVIFIAPLLWSIAAMFSTHSYYNIILSIVFIFHNCVNFIVITHKPFLTFTPHKWYYYYTYIIKQNIAQSVVCMYGFPSYAFIGSFVLFVDPYKVSLVAGSLWLVCYVCSFVFTMPPLRWWGILLIIWGFIRHLCHDHIEKISDNKRHNLIWTLKLFETIIMYTMRWFTFCEMSFPHVIRYDITFFGIMLVIVCTTFISYKIKSIELKYVKQPKLNHFPAPDKETAEICEFCKDIIKIIDVENQEDKIL